ncbi:MAG: hypothetical protein JXQ96_08730 [Cyclobacteriaceae bacterium]
MFDEIVTVRISEEKLEKPVTNVKKNSLLICKCTMSGDLSKKAEENGQGRVYSGIFIQSKYELQIQDNYENAIYVNGQSGFIYKKILLLR